jgi:hypothetical protein
MHTILVEEVEGKIRYRLTTSRGEILHGDGYPCLVAPGSYIVTDDHVGLIADAIMTMQASTQCEKKYRTPLLTAAACLLDLTVDHLRKAH